MEKTLKVDKDWLINIQERRIIELEEQLQSEKQKIIERLEKLNVYRIDLSVMNGNIGQSKYSANVIFNDELISLIEELK